MSTETKAKKKTAKKKVLPEKVKDVKKAEVVEHTPKVVVDPAEEQSRNTMLAEIDNGIPQVFIQAQKNLIMNETPRYKIKKRQGKGGQVFDYVDVGYVIEQLNAICGFRWNFKKITYDTSPEYLKTAVELGQFIVSGTLLIHGKDGIVVEKDDTGKMDIKYKQGGKEFLDLGNDLKGAWSDCLKRCASRFGIALDVYSGAVKRRQDSENPECPITDSQRRRLEVIATDGKIGHVGLKKVIKDLYDYESTKDIMRKHFEEIVNSLSLIEAEANQNEIPEEYQMGFDILGTSPAKRLAMYRSYKNKGMLDELKKKMSDKIDEINTRKENEASK